MADSEPLPAGPRGVGFLLAQIGAHAAAKFGERLEALKLTPPQAGILGVLGRESGLSQQALADVLGMFPSRLVAVLDAMERAELVERRQHPSDRRVFLLNLTATGNTILVATGSPSFFHTMTPLLAVAEILAALVAGRGGVKALAALEHTEAQLAAFGVHLPRRNGR